MERGRERTTQKIRRSSLTDLPSHRKRPRREKTFDPSQLHLLSFLSFFVILFFFGYSFASPCFTYPYPLSSALGASLPEVGSDTSRATKEKLSFGRAAFILQASLAIGSLLLEERELRLVRDRGQLVAWNPTPVFLFRCARRPTSGIPCQRTGTFRGLWFVLSRTFDRVRNRDRWGGRATRCRHDADSISLRVDIHRRQTRCRL